MILTLRTDNPDAEIGLYEAEKQLSYHKWHADRSLAKDLLKVIQGQLQAQKADWQDISGIVVFQGPGSFTGLRIGLTVANTLAYAQDLPIVASEGDDWLKNGLDRLKNGQNDKLALPHYGAEAHITVPKN
jgi:tRNA threonylcarbamoyladenosine biosynthesis protein TsaB